MKNITTKLKSTNRVSRNFQSFFNLGISLIICFSFVNVDVLNAQSVNGRNVNLVSFGNNGQKQGEFRQKNVQKWIEVDSRGSKKFTFKETQRDDWSIYLHDGSRKVDIQLDLHTRKVMYKQSHEHNNRALYNISNATI